MICSGIRRSLQEVPRGNIWMCGCAFRSVEGGEAPGAMFYNGEFSSPWSFCSPPSHMVAPYVAPAAGHVIIYHLLTEGCLCPADGWRAYHLVRWKCHFCRGARFREKRRPGRGALMLPFA
jgi:hypothetical protein